jgi:anti-sigma B factor antagonist
MNLGPDLAFMVDPPVWVVGQHMRGSAGRSMIGFPHTWAEGSIMPKRGMDSNDSAADKRAQRLAAEASVRACQMEVTRAGEEITLALAGEFDASCVLRYERLFRAAVEDPASYVVVDMRDVTFIDSTGLALLLRTEAASRQDGFELQILRSPAAAVRSALEASGLERLLPFVDPRE